MDNMAYLQQISAGGKAPGAKGKFNFSFNPKILIFVGIALALIFFGMIIANMLNKEDTRDRDLTIQAQVRITNLNDTTDDYIKFIKASSLRSMATALKTILSETNREISSIILGEYGLKPTAIKKLPIFSEEASTHSELVKSLENARISGHLDRVYNREYTLQIALLISLENEIIERTKNQRLIEVLQKSIADLQSLHTQFSDYSDFSN